jgi:EmrB/QacA subfamily drug resistance transporter
VNSVVKESKSRILQIIVIVSIGAFMSALDSSIVNISLPAMSTYFNASLTTVEWVVLSYLIIITSLLLTFGRLGDLFGHKIIFNTGLIIFTAGSLFCALSPTIIILIIARVVQAVGAGMLMSMGPAIITMNVAPERRGRSLGAMAVSVSLALIAGPAIGGFLISYFGWQSIFYINLPIGIAVFIWALRVLPVTRGMEKQRFDFIGAVLLFISLIAIVFPLSFADKAGWSNPYIIASIISGIILFAVFIIIEDRIRNPMLDLKLFRSRVFAFGNISLMLNFIAQFAVSLIMPFYLIQLRNFSPSEAGLILIAAPIAIMVVGPVAGYISDKIDARYLSSAGMVLASTGLFLLSTLKEDTKIYLIIIYALVVGFGFGMFQTPNNSAIMGSVAPGRRGTASSMLATMRNLGMVLGVAIAGSVFSTRQNYITDALKNTAFSSLQIQNEAFTGALQLTFIVAGMISTVGIFTSLVRGPLKKTPVPEEK